MADATIVSPEIMISEYQDATRNIVTRRLPYRIWLVYQSLISVAGFFGIIYLGDLFIVYIRDYLISQTSPIAEFQLWLLALFVGYIVGDLIPLSFRGKSLSLGFPIILLTLLITNNTGATNANPQVAVMTAAGLAIVGSSLSETIRHLKLLFADGAFVRFIGRVLFYTAHHIIASLAAAVTFLLVVSHWGPWWELTLLHIQGILAYLAVYALVSMLIVWPHDWLIDRLLIPADEKRFPRVDLLAIIVIAPGPVAIFYFLKIRESNIYEFVFISALFLLFLIIVRSYANIELQERRHQLQEKLERDFGISANMNELLRKLAPILNWLVTYQWAAFYNLESPGVFHLRAELKSGQNPQVYDNLDAAEAKASFATSIPEVEPPEAEMVAHWSWAVQNGGGYLGKVAQSRVVLAGLDMAGNLPDEVGDPKLPRRTAFLYLPLEYKGDVIGLLALARRKRLFKERDSLQLENLAEVMAGKLRQVQQVEDELHRLFSRIQGFTQDPEKVQRAMAYLSERNIDMAKILNEISNRTFHRNLRTVLQGVVDDPGTHQGELDLSPEDLKAIYNQIRDETPDMPPLDDEIMEHLAIVPASLNMAFSFRYLFPDFRRGPEFTQLYRLFVLALEADDIDTIIGLHALMNNTLIELQADRQVQAEIISQLNRVFRVVIILKEIEPDMASDQQRQHLSQALEEIGETENAVRDHLEDPERFIFLNVLSNWRTVITRHLDMVESGSANLELALRRNYILPIDPVTFAIYLRNTGEGTASNLVVKLLPGPEYQVLNQTQLEVSLLAPEGQKELTFTIKPIKEGQLRLQFLVTYRDRNRQEKSRSFADILHLRDSPPPFVTIENMYLVGKALTRNSEVFFGREDVFKFVEENTRIDAKQQQVLLLIGERRIGKTSILMQLPAKVKDKGYIYAFLDGQAIGADPNTPNFFLNLAQAIADGLEEEGLEISLPAYDDLERNPSHVFERVFLQRVWELIGRRRLLIAVDEYEMLERQVKEKKLDEGIIHYLRSLIQRYDELAFIFAGTHELEWLTADYWHVLFNIAKYKRIGFLDREAACRLITNPVQSYNMIYDDLALDELIKTTGGHPYFLQLACDQLVNLCNEQKRNYVTIQSVQSMLNRIIITGRPHLEYIWRNSEPVEQATLASLAKVLTFSDQVTVDDITGQLQKVGLNYDRHVIREALQRFEDRSIIIRQQNGRQVGHYSFTTLLYEMWVQRYHALD